MTCHQSVPAYSTAMQNMEDIWHPVAGWEGLYEITPKGDVRSLARIVPSARRSCFTIKSKILKRWISAQGYACVSLSRGGKTESVTVHSLVAATFIDPRPHGMEVCHNNGVRSDPSVGNLRYGTRAENLRDKVAHGTDNRGENHVSAKLTAAKVREIRADTRTHSAISADYGVSPVQIHRIKARERWAWLA